MLLLVVALLYVMVRVQPNQPFEINASKVYSNRCKTSDGGVNPDQNPADPLGSGSV